MLHSDHDKITSPLIIFFGSPEVLAAFGARGGVAGGHGGAGGDAALAASAQRGSTVLLFIRRSGLHVISK
jgi:hypothetical protein